MTEKTPVALERTDYRLFTPVPTRWCDADALGHINNAVSVSYIESGRIDYFAQVCQFGLTGERYGFVIAHLDVNFIQQIHHPSQLEVASKISRLGNSSFDVDTVIYQQAEHQPLISSRGVCVWLDLQNNTSLRLPDDIRQAIINFEQRTSV